MILCSIEDRRTMVHMILCSIEDPRTMVHMILCSIENPSTMVHMILCSIEDPRTMVHMILCSIEDPRTMVHIIHTILWCWKRNAYLQGAAWRIGLHVWLVMLRSCVRAPSKAPVVSLSKKRYPYAKYWLVPGTVRTSFHNRTKINWGSYGRLT